MTITWKSHCAVYHPVNYSTNTFVRFTMLVVFYIMENGFSPNANITSAFVTSSVIVSLNTTVDMSLGSLLDKIIPMDM